MGGATAIMYMADHVNDSPLPIVCAVIDSCFATFDDIVNTVVGQMGVPAEFVTMLMPQIQQTVEEKAGLKLDELKPVEYAPRCQ